MADENSTEAMSKSISSSSMSESIIAAAGEAHEAVSNMYQDGGAGDMDVRAEISGSTEQRAAPEQHILKSLSIVEEEEEEEEEEKRKRKRMTPMNTLMPRLRPPKFHLESFRSCRL